MDYIKIGQNIRKLSLPVLCDLSKALQVSTDDIITGEHFVSSNASVEELLKAVENCTPQQIKVITETAKSLKLFLEKYA